MKFERSAEIFAAAKQLIPGGVNSPVRAYRSVGGTPVHMARGNGAYVWDVDGNRYLVEDWPSLPQHIREILGL